jgi:hypothetical protein
MNLVRSAALVIATLLLCFSLFAQSDTASMTGVVRDQTGAAVPNAAVVVRNEATGNERRVTTNQDGFYVASNLPPGFYLVSVEATGFKKFESQNNKLDASVNATVNVALTVGSQSETIEVVATAPQVQSDTATVGRVVTQDQIQNLPLNGRNPLFLAQLKAGVRRGSSMAAFSFGLNSGGYSINGSRPQDNLITFDGAPAIRTRANGESIGTADVETLQEIQILTSNYNAEYGRTAGGQIRMVTRSGSNEFHGSFYDFFRNDALDANTWQRNRAGQGREKRRFNQFGYVISGPVTIPRVFNTDRSKLFFLWSQEWVRYRQDNTTTVTVPSAAMRAGNFSELLNPANTFYGRAVAINDPLTGQPFPNNVIPANRLSQNGIGLLNAFPLPTAGFLQGRANFLQTLPQPQNQLKSTVSIDYNLTQTNMFRFRLQDYRWTQVDAYQGGLDRVRVDRDRPNRTATLNWISTISPTVVNEVLVSASVDRVRLKLFENGLYQRGQYGINYPYIYPERKEVADKIPTVDVTGLQTLDGGPYPAASAGPIYTISDNLTWIKSAHTLKLGVYFERSGQNDFDQINVNGVPGGTNNQNGRFEFRDGRPNGTGSAIANVALGLFDRYAEIGPRAYTPYRGHMFEWFAQDAWKATDKLRIELGVRWTYQTPYYYSLWRNMAVFDPSRYNPANAAVLDPATGNVLSGDRFNGVVIPGNGWPDAARGRVAVASTGEYDRLFSGGDPYYGQQHWKNFAPRFGLAYQINENTVFRTGGGRFYQRVGVADNVFLGGNPPFQPMASIANGSVDNPAGGARVGFPQLFMTQDPVFKTPEAWNWSATLERNIGWNTVVSVAYVGRVGLHLERERDLNALLPGTVQANPGVDPNYLRPYKGFANIPMNENAGRSEYNGLQLEVNRRFNGGFAFGFAYTYGKSMDNGSERRARMYNPFDDRNYWGPSNFDTRHVAVFNTIWDLPFLRTNTSLLGTLLGNWQISGVAQFQTGMPFTIGRNGTIAGTGSTDFEPWDVSNIQLNRQFSENSSDPNTFFTATVTPPRAGTFATTQTRNLFYGAGFQNWNMSLFKEFSITERQRLRFRAEAFNLPNHPNLGAVEGNGGAPELDPLSGTFGRITTYGGNRNIQLSLRYSF